MMIGGSGATVPGVPTSVSAVGAGTTSLLVSFSAPANDGGSAITSYTVFVNGGSPVIGASSPISVSGLTASTSYTITVYATNAIGNGSLSSGVTGTTSSNYIGTVLFSSARQWDSSAANYTIPAGTNYIRVKVWGSGGTNAGYYNNLDDGNGGGGGFTDAIISTTPGETLRVAVGTPGNNGSGFTTFSGYAGGFSGIFRSGSPLVMAGGGGGGATNSSSPGGAGGGSSGQASASSAQPGTQSGGWLHYSTNPSGQGEGGGGGYYSGSALWYNGGGGGSGFIGGSGVSSATTTTGNYRTPAGTGDSEYPGGNIAYGGTGYDGAPIYNGVGSGYIIMHCYAINPAGLGVPSPRTVLATY